ncbi:hypothetical protein, partial [Acinetobacter radioresistens]|uniref:hypothetical protein n=1 Tax=Acinetobacter radioresistens TaxID=40216 RepID=UPI00224787D8
MSFYLPTTSNIREEVVQLGAYTSLDIHARYRDNSDTSDGVKQVTGDKLRFDLTQGFDEQILTKSVRFNLGTDTFVDRDGTIYRNPDPTNNSAIASGIIQYGSGKIEIDSWTPNTDNRLTLQSLTTTTDMPPVNRISFRTPVSPLRPGSLTVVVATLDFGQLTLRADDDGIIETSRAHGQINYDTGFVDLFFYTKTEITESNRAGIEEQDWYNVLLEYDKAGKRYINIPVWVAPESVRYNAVAYTYIPLDAEILGLSATRLPLDGRVPIYRVGDIAIVSSSKTFELPDHVAGQIYELPDQRISWAELEDADGVKVPFDMYSVDYDYGKFTLGGDFALNALVAPLSMRYRYQDMLLIRDVQINGQLTFTKPLTHNYDAENTIVGSALVIGDMQARSTGKFV